MTPVELVIVQCLALVEAIEREYTQRGLERVIHTK